MAPGGSPLPPPPTEVITGVRINARVFFTAGYGHSVTPIGRFDLDEEVRSDHPEKTGGTHAPTDPPTRGRPEGAANEVVPEVQDVQAGDDRALVRAIAARPEARLESVLPGVLHGATRADVPPAGTDALVP